jgi:hypothetical protein
MKRIQKFALLALGFALFATGCQKDNVDPSGPPAEKGTFKAYMTDSPGDYEAMNVEILRVDAYIEGEGWVTLNNNSQVVNVLSLTNGAQTQIASTTKAQTHAGVYTQLRIVFGSNNHLTLSEEATLALGGIVVDGHGIFDLDFGGSHEAVVQIHEEVDSKSGAAVLIDFDVAASVKQTADKFIFEPVMSEIEDTKTGVRGHVSGAAHAALTLSNDSGSFSSYANAQGDFLIRGMEDGVYQLKAMPCHKPGDLTEPQPKEISSVTVVEGQITNVGTISF